MSTTFPGLPLPIPSSGAGAGWAVVVRPGSLRAAVTATALVVAAVPAVLAAQLGAGAGYDATALPLSSLSHTGAGWWFPVALALLGAGLLLTAALVASSASRGRGGVLSRRAAVALAAAGAGAATAACFPADAVGASWVGEVHRWGSLLVLVGPLVAGLLVCRTGSRAGSPDGVLRLGLVVAAGAGALFLAGFLPALLGAAPTALTAVQGLTQRALALAVVVVACRCAVLAHRAVAG